jgi:hypothetical protein
MRFSKKTIDRYCFLYALKNLPDYSVNEANLKAALQRQFNGSDTPNDVMWLMK